MSKLITFEGIDGCGKTTQISLLEKILKKHQIDYVIYREPGGTKLSEEIRKILLDKKNKISSIAETLLFLSSRSQLVNERLNDDINHGNIVICDRFIDSTVAYQSYGKGIEKNLIEKINQLAVNNIVPDLTIIFDLDPEIAYSRYEDNSLDRMELFGLDFQIKVREGYLKIANENPDRCHVIDCCNKDIIQINQEVAEIIKFYVKGIYK